MRELREELGIQVEVDGPVYVDKNQFLHLGEMQDNMDYFFAARCDRSAPVLKGVTEDEIAIMKEIRWWSAGEIEAAVAGGGEQIFPEGLAGRVRELAGEVW